MNDIAERIQALMDSKNIDRSELHRRAGLKTGVLRNIFDKRSQNPTIRVLAAVANALECTVDDLISIKKAESYKEEINKEVGITSWNHRLALSCIKISNEIFREKRFVPTVNQANMVNKELYNYSMQKLLKKKDNVNFAETSSFADSNYAEWFISQLIENEK